MHMDAAEMERLKADIEELLEFHRNAMEEEEKSRRTAGSIQADVPEGGAIVDDGFNGVLVEATPPGGREKQGSGLGRFIPGTPQHAHSRQVCCRSVGTQTIESGSCGNREFHELGSPPVNSGRFMASPSRLSMQQHDDRPTGESIVSTQCRDALGMEEEESDDESSLVIDLSTQESTQDTYTETQVDSTWESEGASEVDSVEHGAPVGSEDATQCSPVPSPKRGRYEIMIPETPHSSQENN